MSDEYYTWELPSDIIIGTGKPEHRAVWCDDTGHILFHTDQRVTVPDVTDTLGVVVGFDEQAPSIGVLFDGYRQPIYFDVDMVEAADSDASGDQ